MYDWTYILVAFGALICALASLNVNNTYKRYSEGTNSKKRTANEVAQLILESAGITDVKIERTKGNLTDHYSPMEKVLRLSDGVYNSKSVAALGVAAHECGHAIQHRTNYLPLTLRSASVPVANFGSVLYWPLVLGGLIMGYESLVNIGIWLFFFVVVFQLITLPVEFNASRRALAVLSDNAILKGEELTGAKAVLKAAALTYVAALFSSLLQLLRLILLSRRGNRRD